MRRLGKQVPQKQLANGGHLEKTEGPNPFWKNGGEIQIALQCFLSFFAIEQTHRVPTNPLPPGAPPALSSSNCCITETEIPSSALLEKREILLLMVIKSPYTYTGLLPVRHQWLQHGPCQHLLLGAALKRRGSFPLLLSRLKCGERKSAERGCLLSASSWPWRWCCLKWLPLPARL